MHQPFRKMNSEVNRMICVDSNGQAIEISVADQMWLDDAYFKGKQSSMCGAANSLATRAGRYT